MGQTVFESGNPSLGIKGTKVTAEWLNAMQNHRHEGYDADSSAPLDAITAALSALVPTGITLDYVGSTAPAGYVFLSGRTIGNAASGATERANSDTSALFSLLWNSMANSEAAVSGGKGASAAADFAANKTITLPDARGRVIAGKDNMGGTTASRITAAGAGIVGTTLGAVGGAQSHVLTINELAPHDHTFSVNYNTGAGGVPLQGSSSPSATVTTSSKGSGAAHQTTQPTLILNKIIKL